MVPPDHANKLKKKHSISNDQVNNYTELQIQNFDLISVILRTTPYLLPPNPIEQSVINLERSQYLQNVNNCYELVTPYKRMLEKRYIYIYFKKIIIRTIKCAYIINPHIWQPYQVKEIMGKADLSILKNTSISYHTPERKTGWTWNYVRVKFDIHEKLRTPIKQSNLIWHKSCREILEK